MSTQKQRIADFIESVETEEVGLSTVLLGGATKPSDGTMATSNDKACENVSIGGCGQSRNGGNCKNVADCCNDSTNGGKCNNGWLPKANNCPSASINSCV